MNLDSYLMTLAAEAAKQSGDKDRKVGCVITDKDGRLLVSGYNELPTGCTPLEERRCRPHKYLWTEHAERRALNAAARFGVAVDGGTAFVTYFPCAECARSMVDSGITAVRAPRPDILHPTWGKSWQDALAIFRDAKVDLSFVEVPDVSE